MLDDEMLMALETQFIFHLWHMKPKDLATIYFFYTRAGFKGSEQLYERLLQVVSRTIGEFKARDLQDLFQKFDDVENTRLDNTTRGHMIEHCKFLVDSKKLTKSASYNIYQNTKALPCEEGEKLHSLPRMLQDYRS